MIVIVFGLPGTGKSYFASRLAEKIKAEYIGSDQIRFGMIEDRTYDEKEKMRVYGKMLMLTEQSIKEKKHVVLDGTFYRKEIRQMFVSWAESLKVSFCFIEVTAPESLVTKRVSKKRKDSDADYQVYLKIKEIFEPMKEKHLTLESTQSNIEEMLQKAVRYLDQPALKS